MLTHGALRRDTSHCDCLISHFPIGNQRVRMKTIAVAEPHPLLRAGLLHILAGLADTLAVHCIDPTAPESVLQCPQQVDLLILAVSDDADEAVATLRLAAAHLHPKRVLVLCPSGSCWYAGCADYAELAYGCITDDACEATLVAAIRLGLDMREPDAAPLPAPQPAPRAAPLALRLGLESDGEARMLDVTPRQYALLCRFSRGLPLKAIAQDLGISTATARAHASALYERLGVRSKNEAVYVARQRGAHLDE